MSRAQRWGINFLCAVIVLSFLVCFTVYLIDPFFQYRVKDNVYFMNAAYVDAGLIRNYDYDTIIIGSCMVENYDIEKFDSTLGVNAVKIGCGGMGPDGVISYLMLANEAGKAKNYYINIDLAYFGNGDNGETSGLDLQRGLNMNEYDFLLKNDPISKLKYSFSYEAWFRFIPVDLGLIAYKMVRGDILGGKLGVRTSIAHNGEWSDDYIYGEETVMKSRENSGEEGIKVLDEKEQEELLQTMEKNIDAYLGSIDFKAGNYTFVFPPYSYLFWEDAKTESKYDTYVEAKNYLINKIKQNGGTVYDFQNSELIYDLNYYHDTMHYSKYMNDYMIECMATGEYMR